MNLERTIQACVDVASHIIAYTPLPIAPTMADAFVQLHLAGVIPLANSERMHQAVGLLHTEGLTVLIHARLGLLAALALPACRGHDSSGLAEDSSAPLGICAAINDAQPQGLHRQACEEKRASLHAADTPDDFATANELCSDQEILATPAKDGSKFATCLRRALTQVKARTATKAFTTTFCQQISSLATASKAQEMCTRAVSPVTGTKGSEAQAIEAGCSGIVTQIDQADNFPLCYQIGVNLSLGKADSPGH